MKNRIEVAILYFTMLIFFTSCGTPKFYNEIITMQNKTKSDINKQNISLNEVKIKGNDMNKVVLNKLKEELRNTNQIIYHYSPDSSISSKKIWFTIYDVDNKIYYNLETNSLNPRHVDLIKKTEYLKDSYTSFVFENYLNSNCDLLKDKGEEKISGTRTYEVIYYVNLITKENNYCFFKNFILLE